MSVDKNRIKNCEINNVKNVTAKKVDKVNMELLLTLNETTQILQNNKCKDVVPYILWNDFVNNKGTLSIKTNESYNRYVWGTKIFVNFGMTNIQTELSYPHPAILLYNFANTAIVVPTTTDDKTTAFTSDIEKCIIKVKKDNLIFPNNSIINLHQICSIHKERIISDLNCNVKNFIVDNDEIDRLNSYENHKFFQNQMNLLDCIKMKLSLMFNSDYLNEVFNLKIEIQKLQEENNILKKYIDTKENK